MANKTITVDVQMNGGNTIEKTVNAFTSLKQEIKAAQGELARYEQGSEAFTRAQKRVTDLKDKMGDLNDATRIQGTGVEKLSASFSLLTQSLGTGDLDKAKLAMEGIGGAMKAIPIFLLIEGVKLLWENWDKVSAMFSESAQAAKLAERAMKDLANAVDVHRTYNDRNIISLEGELEQLKLQEAPLQVIIDKLKQINDLKKENVSGELKKIDSEMQNLMAKLNSAKMDMREGFWDTVFQMGNSEEDLQKMKDELTALMVKRGDTSNQILAIEVAEKNQLSSLNKEYNEKHKKEKEHYTDLEIKEIKSILPVEVDNTALLYAERKKRLDEIAKLEEAAAKANQARILKVIELENKEEFKGFEGKKKLLDLQMQDELSYIESVENNEAAQLAIRKKYAALTQQLQAEQITKTAQTISSVTSQLSGMLSQLSSIQQESTNQRLQAIRMQSEAEMAAFEHNTQVRLVTIEDEKNTTLNTLQAQYEAQISGEQLSSDQRQVIDAQYQAARRAAEKKAIKDKQTADNNAAKQKYALDLATYKAETDARKKGFEQQKKLQIATTVMNTIMGSVAALTGMIAAIPGPAGVIAGGFAAAAVAAMGAFQVSQIKKQQFDAGTPPQAPVLPQVAANDDEDAGGSAGPAARPNRATLFSTGQSQRITLDNSGQPIKTYVLAQDVTNQQELDAAIKSRNTY